jgi:hypothetical protein
MTVGVYMVLPHTMIHVVTSIQYWTKCHTQWPSNIMKPTGDISNTYTVEFHIITKLFSENCLLT